MTQLADSARYQPVLSQLRQRVTPEGYKKIRREWEIHSIAEEKRDIPGLLSTLTEDCVYELGTGEKIWHGHAGAAQFYTELLTAFPDIHFELRHIIIGPQGVFEEAHVTATQVADWVHIPSANGPVEFNVLILFPWNAEKEKFSGERVYFFNMRRRD